MLTADACQGQRETGRGPAHGMRFPRGFASAGPHSFPGGSSAGSANGSWTIRSGCPPLVHVLASPRRSRWRVGSCLEMP